MKRVIRNATAFMIAIGLAIALIFAVKQCAAVSRMNIRELKYDADGYIVLVDTSNDIIGIYFGTENRKTIYKKTDYECEHQEVHKIDELPELEFVKLYVPDGTPVVIY